EQVFDSGDQFARILADILTDEQLQALDGRSDNKGSEPEGVTIGQVGDQIYAFIGLERANGVMVFNVTNPVEPEFVEYLQNDGDIGPEGLEFIPASESPNGEALLAVANEVSGTTTLFEIKEDDGTTEPETFKLQILHASDLEGGVSAIGRAPNFAAIVDFLEEEVENSITLSAGDNYLPGPFFSAASDQAAFRDSGIFNDFYNELFGLDPADGYQGLREGSGRVDIAIMNAIGFDASALGNHEFDLGADQLESIIEADFRGAGLADDRNVGALFPYLSANLDFSNSSDLANLTTTDILANTEFGNGPDQSLSGDAPRPQVAPATIIEEGGEQIGIVGATTPLLATISSPGDVTTIGPNTNDMAALAAVLQPVIDQLLAQDINKIVLVSHLQQIALEQELAGLL
ncbi:MAG: bifunctional metallophosphatase/5'-nucleotidase, partial [Pseudomonadota bacterium]